MSERLLHADPDVTGIFDGIGVFNELQPQLVERLERQAKRLRTLPKRPEFMAQCPACQRCRSDLMQAKEGFQVKFDGLIVEKGYWRIAVWDSGDISPKRSGRLQVRICEHEESGRRLLVSRLRCAHRTSPDPTSSRAEMTEIPFTVSRGNGRGNDIPRQI